MAIIQGFRVQNYRALRDITLGKLWNLQTTEPLTPMTAVIGKNGVGKSTLFDAFGFLADCLKLGVEEACDATIRVVDSCAPDPDRAAKYDPWFAEYQAAYRALAPGFRRAATLL